jgi:LL-diaminopimelate aminotransferase
MFLNYPNNPTGATASLDYFKEVAAFAAKNKIMVVHDAAYTEIYFEEKPHSFLEVPGAKDIAIEMHSLSKTYNMTGWRVAFAVGNAQIIQGLAKVKSNVDSGIFQALQWAGIRALQMTDEERAPLLKTYQERRDVLVEGLRQAGWKVKSPKASFYVWTTVPEGYDSKSLALKLLNDIGIVATPGVGFGKSGEGYIRFSLTVPVTRLREAVQRLKDAVLV